MNKRLARLRYGLQDVGKDLLKTGADSIFFWLHFSSRPFRTLMLFDTPIEKWYPKEILKQRVFWYSKKGFIKKIKKGREAFFLFNRQNRYSFLDKYLGIKENSFSQKWDQKWRLIIYDIPDKRVSSRDRLRALLIGMGFGKVQNSCWVSCYDHSKQIHDFCSEKNLLDHICIYEGSFFSGKNVEKLVEEAWGLQKLANDYLYIYQTALGYLRELETQDNVDLKSYYSDYCELFTHFKSTLTEDPFLPKEFSSLFQEREKTEKTLLKLFHHFTNKLLIPL